MRLTFWRKSIHMRPRTDEERLADLRADAAALDAAGVPLGGDPFWDARKVLERVEAAHASGANPTLAALGGPFVIPDNVPSDAISVDHWISFLADKPIAGEPT